MSGGPVPRQRITFKPKLQDKLDANLFFSLAAASSLFVLSLYYMSHKMRKKTGQTNQFIYRTGSMGKETPSEPSYKEDSIGRKHAFARILFDLPLLYIAASSSQAYGNESFGIFWSPIKSEFIYYLYALCLITLSARNHNSWRPALLLHHDVLVFLSCIIYAYQDLWPLATNSRSHSDPLHLQISSQMAMLLVTGVIFPLNTPYLMTFTGDGVRTGLSLWSKLTYSYLDKLIYSAGHDTSLKHVPFLDVEARCQTLTRRMKFLLQRQTLGKRHIFWHLLKEFRVELIKLSFLQLSHTVLFLTGPIGMNGLLKYLEENDKDPDYKPWVWILLLFFGPSTRTILLQLYTSSSDRLMIQLEAILTHVVYDYTLRLRCHGSGGREKQSSSNQVGMINNLVTTDIGSITAGVGTLVTAFYSPIMVIQSLWFLFNILGWSAILAFVVMLLMLALPARFSKTLGNIHKIRSKKTDTLVQKIVEVMSIARTIKLLGWGTRVKRQIGNIRQQELEMSKRYKLMDLWIGNLNFLIPLITMLVAYSTFTILLGKELTSSRVFASMVVFEALRPHIRMVLVAIPILVQGKVSFDRFNDFVQRAELMDDEGGLVTCIKASHVVGFRNCHFSWSKLGSAAFSLEINGDLFLEPGLTLVIGPTGCGKTSLLMAFLGEMYLTSPAASTQVALPNHLGIAYAAQDPWIHSGTVKQNILFGSRCDEERYLQGEILSRCGLRQDLDQWPEGDLTRIGERGLTISGGQRARISLARAIYSTAKVLLLDDIFAALDSQTANWVAQRCFCGNLMQNRIVLLVTHHHDLLKPMAKAVVTIDSEGNCLYEALNFELILMQHDIELDDPCPLPTGSPTPEAEPTESDERDKGHSKRDAYRSYLSNMSSHGGLLWSVMVLLVAGNDACTVMQAYWLGYWASQYENHAHRDISALFYFAVLVGIGALSMTIFNTYLLLFLNGALRASRRIHSALLDSVLGSTWNWLDMTPTARVIVRATQDMRTIDDSLPVDLRRVLEMNISIMGKLLAIGIFSPYYIIPAIFITFLGMLSGQLYMQAQLPIRRMMAGSKTPILAHFSGTMEGIVSIRTFKAQEQYTKKLMEHIDGYSRLATTYWGMNRWVSIRSDVLGGLFTAGLSAYMVYVGRGSASNTGFSLTMSFTLSTMILAWVRWVNKLELDGTLAFKFQVRSVQQLTLAAQQTASLERVHDYLTLEQERVTSEHLPPASWPSRGDLKAVNLSAKYHKEGECVLNHLNFEIKSGEKIGIVGRTGAGKSSLVLAILQCLTTEGDFYLDGIPIKGLSVETLRSKFTVIPQTPDLFDGSLRDNLDPLHEFEDAELQSAIQSVGLELFQNDQESQNVLDIQVIGRGENISVGQRQLIALGRALLQRNKVLILDEATSAIDFETDAAIQRFLRNELEEVTILTVAHRLRTVIDFDRIMVLSEGKIVEFDRPKVLLEIQGGYLRGMVDSSADKDELYALAVA